MIALKTFLLSLLWRDFIDIGINSYIIFRLYVLFRGTNALNVFIGIVFLLIFQQIAVVMGLVVTSWAIQGIGAAAAIIIIVVFRNEIRLVFQAQNLRSLFWGVPGKKVYPPFEIIASSVYEMAQKKIGVLIVFPGKDDLDHLLHNGIPWSGKISKEMLSCIFWKNNPVHDGAIVIQGDYIEQVCVLLPLSNRTDLPLRYGTRHRAAIGLTEKTDAMVIVVSEERGLISFVRKGKIQEVCSIKALVGLLTRYDKKKSIKNTSYYKEKRQLIIASIISVFLVTIVWFNLTRGMETFVSFESPLKLMNLKPGMEIIESSASTIKIQFSGSGALIRSIRPEQIQVKLNLNKVVVGRNTYKILAKNISSPPGIMIKKVVPSEVKIFTDKIERKTIPIQVNWVGKLDKHLLLSNLTMKPIQIGLIGPSLDLDAIHTIYTEPIRLNEIKQSGQYKCKLIIPNRSIKVANKKLKFLVVDVVIKPRAPLKE